MPTGYFGTRPKGYDAATTKPIGSFEFSHRTVMRNKRILRKRALVEYPFAIMKSVFHFSHTLVILSRRVRVKFMFSCFSYNILQ
ncbi:MAG: transposase [Candidatus Parvarchaeota archaeon]